MMSLPLITILGSADLGTACALRFFRSGFKVVLLEEDIPKDVHYARNFSSVAYSGTKDINGVRARTPADLLQREALALEDFENSFLRFILNNNEIPFLSGDDIQSLLAIRTDYLVITKKELLKNVVVQKLLEKGANQVAFNSINIEGAHYAIDGRGLVQYPFLMDSYEPKPIESTMENICLLKSKLSGIFSTQKEINTWVRANEEICKIGDISLHSPCEGMLSGCLNSGLYIAEGDILVEISKEKGGKNDGKIIPNNNTLLAGGALEAVLFDLNLKKK
jgi:hypothetical protein